MSSTETTETGVFVHPIPSFATVYPSLPSLESPAQSHVSTLLSLIAPLQRSKRGFDALSKRHGMPELQRVLSSRFGRTFVPDDLDAHAVMNYEVERTVSDLDDDEDDLVFAETFHLPVSRLRSQAESFRVYYIEELVTPDDITSHFEGKHEGGRDWNVIFNKHFYVTLSSIDILYDFDGNPLPFDPDLQPTYVVSTVGFDVSAHRLTGVHFGDYLRLLIPKRDRRTGHRPRNTDIVDRFQSLYPEGEEERLIDAKHTKLWNDAYHGWLLYWLVGPKNVYHLRSDLLRRDSILQFSLMFESLRLNGVQIPVIGAVGCGVFGHRFYPEYQRAVAKAYLHVLSLQSYDFVAVVFAEVNTDNLTIFRETFSSFSSDLKIPFLIVSGDMLTIARSVSQHYVTSIHNAADLWEFGQFWEGGGGALEEYVTRMTSAYFANHFILSPLVTDSSRAYVGLSVNELGLGEDEGIGRQMEGLKGFIGMIRERFVRSEEGRSTLERH